MVYEEVHKINEYLSKQLWMDFEVCCLGRGEVGLYGFLDESGDNYLKIIFKNPFMVISPFCFTYSGDGEFISILEGDEAFKINRKYGITQDNILFKIINIEDITGEIIIAAKEIFVEIYKE